MNADLNIREAVTEDVPAVVGLLADDALGRTREADTDPLPMEYYHAFFAIDKEPNNRIFVAERDGRIVGTLQLIFLPHLTYRGGWRAQIEAVRVAREERGSGIGKHLIEWAVSEAQSAGCHLVQLTTDGERPEAKRFYEALGFEATHVGFKRHLAGRT